MTWFGKLFIKICKIFINFIILVATRTCSSARVRSCFNITTLEQSKAKLKIKFSDTKQSYHHSVSEFQFMTFLCYDLFIRFQLFHQFEHQPQ